MSLRTFLLALSVTASLVAQSPIVSGARHAGSAVERGHTLVGELGCAQCHDGTPDSGVAPRRAPDLSRIGERARGHWIARFIADPQGTKPGTTMPHVTTPENAELIAHWLVSRSRSRPQSVAPDLGAAARGERLFHQVGCVACHAPRSADAEPLGEPSVALPPDIEKKYALAGLERFLRDPLRARPSGRMPSLGLRGGEARDIAHYLLASTPVPGALNYAYYPERHETLDTFDPDAEPRQTGLIDGFTPEFRGRRGGDFALRFTGFLDVPTDGTYTFEVTSDDGSRLYLDGNLVVDNDGHRRNQKPVTKSASVDLRAGRQAIELRYFQRVRNTVIDVRWSGPGFDERPIDEASLSATKDAVTPLPDFAVDTEKARRGEALFVSEGCGSCHQVESAPKRPTGVPSLAGARPDQGCLSASPTGGAPDFKLTHVDRAAIRAALKASEAPASEATKISRRLRSFDCYACHERDGIGGPSEARERWFTSAGHNQGQEGRIPPRITGVGDKLKPAWLERVLVDGASVRPLFHTRMPRFGGHNLEGLAAALVKLDRKPSSVPQVDDDPETQRRIGRKLIGPGGGFNCTSCHEFNQREAPVMQMVDLVGVTNRIHEDWFQRWIRDPGRYNPGTRMPQYLAHPEFLDGDRDRQFAAIWTYLSDGKKAVLPDGLSRQNLELIVGGEAIVYRGKIRNVGFRGLCVGHPEDANVAYDAEGCAPRLLWKGRFLNVAAHWRSQSMGRIGPLGHDVITLPKGDVWWNTERPASQPPIRPRFRGYRLGEKRRPTLLYDLPGKRVAETGVMRELKDGRREFVRTLSLATGNRPSASSYRHAVASGKKIERRDGGFLIDGRWTVRVDGAEAAVDEDARPPTVFIEFGGSDEQIEVRYQW